MIQQGQVFKLKAKGPDGQPLWSAPQMLHTGGVPMVRARSLCSNGAGRPMRFSAHMCCSGI